MTGRDAATERMARDISVCLTGHRFAQPAEWAYRAARMVIDRGLLPALERVGNHCPGCDGDHASNRTQAEIWSAVCPEERVVHLIRCWSGKIDTDDETPLCGANKMATEVWGNRTQDPLAVTCHACLHAWVETR